MDAGQVDDMAPPQGTAIVRPLRHVRAVRERYLQQFTDPAAAASSRSARAWAWALGDTSTSPVTDRVTAVPPSRPEIEAEIAVADERRLRGDQENRADAAATVLRWLIGGDDHVPVQGKSVGQLVDGFGDVVRSREQIADVLALADKGHRQAVAVQRNPSAGPADRQFAQRNLGYLRGVTATLRWVLAQRAEAPITSRRHSEVMAKELKAERLHADDLIAQAKQPRLADRLLQYGYGEGVESTITWLLGDCITLPVNSAGHHPCDQPS